MSDTENASVTSDVAIKIEIDDQDIDAVEQENYRGTEPVNVSATDDEDQSIEANNDSTRMAGVENKTEPMSSIVCEMVHDSSNVGAGQTEVADIVVPEELPETMDTTSCSNSGHNCIICYKLIDPATEHENIGRSDGELLQVFCRYMQIERPDDAEEEREAFCENCRETVELLVRLDADLKTLQIQTSKIALRCTAEILQSCSSQRRSQIGRVDTLRRQIFNRYNAKVIVRDCHQEENDNESFVEVLVLGDYHQQEDDNESFVELLVPEVKLGDDVEDVVVKDLTDTEEKKLIPSPRKRKPRKIIRKTVKTKKDVVEDVFVMDLTDTEEKKLKVSPRRRKLRKIIRKTKFKEDVIHSDAPPLRSSRRIGTKNTAAGTSTALGKVRTETTSSGTKINYREISTGQYVYMNKYHFEDFRTSQYKCKICLRAYPSIEAMIDHIPLVHFPRRKKEADEVVDVFYANGFRVEKVGKRYRCPECPKQHNSKYEIKKHIIFKHYFRKDRAKGQVSTETNVSAQQTASEPGTSSNGGTQEPTSSVAVAIDDPENGEQIDGPVVPDAEVNDDEEFNSAEELGSGSEEEDVKEAEYIPESVRRRMKREERLANSKLKEISPGKFVYGEQFEFEQTGEASFKCHDCKRSLKTKKEMVEHVRGHYYKRGTTRKNFRIVEVEDGVFLYADKYYFDKMGDKYSCRECGYLSKSQERAKILGHVRTKHLHPPKEKEEESCMCAECGKIFGNMKAMQVHIDRMHNEGEKTEICSTCGKSFYLAKDRRVHERMHGTTRPRNFVCEHCGKAFDSNQKLRSHVTIHTGEKPFECKHCNEKFKHYNVMVVHQKHCNGMPAVIPAVIPPVQEPELPRQPQLFQPHPSYGPFGGQFPPPGAFFPGF